MKVVVVTSQRPWEVTQPLDTTDIDTCTLHINPEDTLPRRFFQTLKKTNQAIQEYDPDLLLLDVYDVPGLITAIVAKFHGIPIVTRVVGDRLGELGMDRIRTQTESANLGNVVMFTLMYALSRPIVAASSGLIVVSNELKTKMVHQTRHSEKRIGVVPVPFRDDTFSRRKFAVESDNRHTTILTVTNLEYRGKYEGVHEAISGIVPLLEKRDDLRYRIAGDGAYLSELEDYVEQELSPKSREQIDVLGYVDDIDSEYSDADIFLYISHLDGYPNAVLEAQGMGLPIVTNCAKGMEDQVEEGVTGLFVDPKDPEDIRRTLEYLSEDRTLQRSLGGAARQTVLQRNSPEQIGEQMKKSLEKILKNQFKKNDRI